MRHTLTRLLAGNPSIALIEPQPYSRFVALLMHSRLILSDSGGVQEEGLALGKKVLVVRQKTERPEGLAKGLLQIVGVDRTTITEVVSQAWGLTDAATGRPFIRAANPFGDGRAAERIAALIAQELGVPKIKRDSR